MQDFSSITVNSQNKYNGELSSLFKTPREFSFLESIWSWICLFLGYLFCRAFPAIKKPLYALIFVILLYALTTVMLILKKAKFGKAAILASASGILVAFSLFLSDNTLIHTVAFGYAIFAYCYYVCAATENRLEGGFSSYILIDFLKATFVVPFSGTGGIVAAMFSKKNNKLGSIIGKVIVGVMIAIIPTAVVFSLLSFDRGFLNLLSKIFSFSIGDIAEQLASVIFAFPIGAYIFRLLISSFDKSAKKTLTLKSCKEASKKASIAPIITVFSATLPLLFMYVVFFISQWKYYISGFLGELPENVNYATYARDGFFQLLAVSAINLAVIAAIALFVKKGNSVGENLIKILNIIICVFTLILISTAISKLVLYINEHGLTPKRVHAFWFMLVLTLIFVTVILKQFIMKIKLIPIGLAVTVAMFFALSVSGSDALIAKYNVDRYLEGSLDRIIVSDLEKLGDAALPQYIRLEKELKERENAVTSDTMYEYFESNDFKLLSELEFTLEKCSANSDYNWYEITLPKLLAESALKERN